MRGWTKVSQRLWRWRSWAAADSPLFESQGRSEVARALRDGPRRARPHQRQGHGSGTLSALVTVQVGCQVSGRIESLRADFGSRVKKGEVFATMDPQLFRAALQQARANRSSALASLEKAKVQARTPSARTTALAARCQKLVSQADADTATPRQGCPRPGLARPGCGGAGGGYSAAGRGQLGLHDHRLAHRRAVVCLAPSMWARPSPLPSKRPRCSPSPGPFEDAGRHQRLRGRRGRVRPA